MFSPRQSRFSSYLSAKISCYGDWDCKALEYFWVLSWRSSARSAAIWELPREAYMERSSRQGQTQLGICHRSSHTVDDKNMNLNMTSREKIYHIVWSATWIEMIFSALAISVTVFGIAQCGRPRYLCRYSYSTTSKAYERAPAFWRANVPEALNQL